MKDQERDLLRKTILLLLLKGPQNYTTIEKKTVASCLLFATSNTVQRQFYGYLVVTGYVSRVKRGVYKITQKGERLLELLK